MSKKSDGDIFTYLTKKNIRKHLIYNDPTRPNEMTHLIALPMDQFIKYLDENRDINRYLWNLTQLKAPCLSKICTRLQLYKYLRAQGQYSIEAMIAAINTQTGNRKVRFYSTVNSVSSEVPHAIKSEVPRVITRGVSRRERAAHIKDSGRAIETSDNESSAVLAENVIDEKIELLLNKVGHRIGKLNHYLDTCSKLIDEKEQAMERTIQSYKDSLLKKEQLLQEYEERIQETKQSIRELKNSIYEKRRSWDQFRETMDISLEEGNTKYQCVGEALERTREKLKL